MQHLPSIFTDQESIIALVAAANHDIMSGAWIIDKTSIAYPVPLIDDIRDSFSNGKYQDDTPLEDKLKKLINTAIGCYVVGDLKARSKTIGFITEQIRETRHCKDENFLENEESFYAHLHMTLALSSEKTEESLAEWARQNFPPKIKD
jgi:hypothetical protein